MVESRRDMTPGLLSGRLEGISVPDLMWALCRRGADGLLRISRGAVRKTIYVQGGDIVFAASSDPDDRLGELLLREGVIRLEHLEGALGKLGTGKRLGTILVEAGHLSPDDLVKGVLQQVRSIVLDAFTWTDGEYGFEPGPLPTQEVITLDMGTGQLLLQGIRRTRSFSRIRRSVGPPRTRYRLRTDARHVLESLDLNSGERELVARLERDDGTVESLCQDVLLSNFEVYQTLWALRVLGLVDVDERSGTVVDDAAVAGRFGAESLVPVLVRMCRARETGVLYVSRGSLERTVHVRDGRVVFATSNDIDDGLINYLLRRGVISLRDREETAKRLLSNKRVGTILRELGVIDDVDLRTMVREQLTEIVQDTLAWRDGEYAFVPGELPTIEDITLDETVESLVARGLRRVHCWSRVRDGIGGVRQRLALTPEFLAVLDRMSIGPEEWEVVTALKEPRSTLEICGTTGLTDFRVAQILWTLRILGAVTPADETIDVAEREAEAAAAAGVSLPASLAFDDPSGEGVASADPDEDAVETAVADAAAGGRSADRDPSFDEVDARETATETGECAAPVADPADESEVEVGVGPETPIATPEPVRVPVDGLDRGDAGESSTDSGSSEDGEGKVPVHVVADHADLEPRPSHAPDAGVDPVADELERSESDASPSWDADGALRFEVDRPGAGTGFEEQAYFGESGPRESDGEPHEPWLDRVVDVEALDDGPSDAVRDDARDEDSPPFAVAETEDGESDGPSDAVSEPEPGTPAPIAGFGAEDPYGTCSTSPDATQALDPEVVRAVIGPPSSGEEPGADSADHDSWDGAEAHEAVESPDDVRTDEPVAAHSAPDDGDSSAAGWPAVEFADETSTLPDPDELEADRVEAGTDATDDPCEEDATQEEIGSAVEGDDRDWLPPGDLEETIARFNARQRVLYRSIRAEVGAGAVNFVRSCCDRVGGKAVDPDGGVELRPDGTWDVDGLRAAVVRHRMEDPRSEYERLLELEFDLLRIHIGEARARSLREQMEQAVATRQPTP